MATVPRTISEQERNVGELEKDWANKKESAKIAREAFDDAVSTLRAMIREESEPGIFTQGESDDGK